LNFLLRVLMTIIFLDRQIPDFNGITDQGLEESMVGLGHGDPCAAQDLAGVGGVECELPV